MRTTKTGFRIALTFALLLFIGAQAARTDAADVRQVEAAKKEGEVIWYTAMNTSDGEVVRKLFQEKYPSVTLTILRQPGEKIRTRILTEMQAGKYLWDVVSFNHLDMDALNQEGLLASYHSPEAKSGYPKGAVDPDGRWAAIYVRQFVIGFNTNLVPAAEAPKSWDDLLQSKWKAKFSLDESDVEWYAAMLEYMGREKGLSFMRALSKQNPQFRRGHSLLSRLLIAGDFPLAMVYASEVDEAKKSGAPVEWVYTLDPIVTSPSQIAISLKAPHPHAARLLVDLLLSAEGQALIRGRGRVPARIDTGADGAARLLKVHYVNPRLSREFSQYEKEFREIFLKSR